jgi:hypothetical protein
MIAVGGFGHHAGQLIVTLAASGLPVLIRQAKMA